jgi:hypothetical protein
MPSINEFHFISVQQFLLAVNWGGVVAMYLRDSAPAVQRTVQQLNLTHTGVTIQHRVLGSATEEARTVQLSPVCRQDLQVYLHYHKAHRAVQPWGELWTPESVALHRQMTAPAPAVVGAVCDVCYGTGYTKGFGAPCAKRCKP